jgi:hypothetical protein
LDAESFANLLDGLEKVDWLKPLQTGSGSTMDAASQQFSKALDVPVSAKIGDMVPLQMMPRNRTRGGYVFLTRTETTMAGEARADVLVGSGNFFLVHDKALLALLYSAYEGRNDREWVATAATSFMDAVQKANPDPAARPGRAGPASHESSPWSGGAVGGMVKGAILASLVLVVRLVRRWRSGRRWEPEGTATTAARFSEPEEVRRRRAS